MIILTKATLDKYVELGLVESRRHPTLPLSIYNYTRRCQYEAAWDEVTIQCRGLIMNDTGTIVSRGFNKFFNYEELLARDSVPTSAEWALVQKKMDGSLGILFNYEDRWIMATRGSFESEQAETGLKIANERYNLSQFDPNVTYLCEIIYPENRIVVDYGDEAKLVFLSAIRFGTELEWESAVNLFALSKIPHEDVVESKRYSAFGPDLYRALKAEQLNNEEGFVIRFGPSNERMKIKFDEYVRLHRLMTSFSNLDIWERLKRDEDPMKDLDAVPDEFDEWIREQIAELKREFWSVNAQAYLYHGVLLEKGFETRKEQAIWINERVEESIRPLVFKILDGGSPEPIAWKIVKPKKAMPMRNSAE